MPLPTTTAAILLSLALGSAGALVGAELTPGKHRKLETAPGSGIFYDLVIPSAYATQAERRFPVLFTQVTAEGASTFGHDAWAEAEGVIICPIHNNGNHGQPGSLNEIEMQDHVIRALEQTIRIHPCLRFSTGVSASAARAMVMAKRHPDSHAGVLMTAHSGSPSGLARHICVAFAHGRNDTVHEFKYVEASVAQLQAQGNPVRFYYHNGGHNGIDKNDKETGSRRIREMLTWMLWHSKLNHPGLDAADRKLHAEELVARVTGLAAQEDKATALVGLQALLELDGILKSRDIGRPLLEAWGACALAEARSKPAGAERLWALNELQAHPYMKGHPLAKELKAAIETTEDADEALADETRAWQAWHKASGAEEDAAGAKTKLVAAARAYHAIAEKFPGTIAGGKARAAADRLAAQLQ